MLRDVDAAEVGQTVHLYPNSKQAGVECYQRPAVVIIAKLTAYWPRVYVQWADPNRPGQVLKRLVHRDNIRLHPSSKNETAGGDSTTDHAEPVFASPRVVGAKPKPIELGSEDEQMELF